MSISFDDEPLFLEKYNACKNEDDEKSLLLEYPKITTLIRLHRHVLKIRGKFKEEARMSKDGNTISRKTGTFDARKLLLGRRRVWNKPRYKAKNKPRKNENVGVKSIRRQLKKNQLDKSTVDCITACNISYEHHERMIYFSELESHLKEMRTSFPLGPLAFTHFKENPHEVNNEKIAFGIYMVNHTIT